MSHRHNYAVAGLQKPDRMNVLSLEQRTLTGNILPVDDTGNRYVVLWCDEPLPTEFDAALLAINGRVTCE